MAEHQVTFKGNLPSTMEIYVKDAEGKKVPLYVKEATITLKPHESSAHLTLYQPTLDLEDIPATLTVVTPDMLQQQQAQLSLAAKEAFNTWLKSMNHTDDRYHQFMMSQLDTTYPRFFVLYRRHDASTVSGTGFIAAGIEYQDGLRYARPVHLFWMGQFATKGEYKDISQLLAIHGETEIVWLDTVRKEHHVLDKHTKG